MSAALVVVWLAGAAPPTPPPALNRWAAARGVTLRGFATGAAALPYPAKTAAQIEALLKAARLDAGRLRHAQAVSKLATVDQLLRQHPVLPQSAWLMAQRLRLEASVHAGDEATARRAAELMARADALEGPRARGVTDASVPAVIASKRAFVEFAGLAPGDRVVVDGEPSKSTRWSGTAGDHHVLVRRNGQTVHGSWQQLRGGTEAEHRAIALTVPPAPACTAGDFRTVRASGSTVQSKGTRCQHWVAVRRRGSNVEAARCRRDDCEPLFEWRSGFATAFTPPAQREFVPGWPVWGTWVVVGLVAATTVAAVLWQTGAFDDPPAGRTRFVYQPPSSSAALRF